MLQITDNQVRELLPMGECVARMRECFAALGRGEAVNVPRRRLFLPTGTVMHQLAGAWGGYLGTKIYTTNAQRGAMYFHLLLYDAASAEPLALIEANHLGQIRTGAASGVATELLAAAAVSEVALIGAGFQAWTQLEASAERAAGAGGAGVQPEGGEAGELRGARARGFRRRGDGRGDGGSMCTRGAGGDHVDLRQGAGAGKRMGGGAGARQCDGLKPGRPAGDPDGTRAAGRAIAVDSIEQARIEAGDLLLAVPQGEWGGLPLVELSRIAADAGFRRPDGVTIFESLGLGVQDVAAAALVYEKLTGQAA